MTTVERLFYEFIKIPTLTANSVTSIELSEGPYQIWLVCNNEVRFALHEVQVEVHELILVDYSLVRYDKLQEIFLELALLQVLKF